MYLAHNIQLKEKQSKVVFAKRNSNSIKQIHSPLRAVVTDHQPQHNACVCAAVHVTILHYSPVICRLCCFYMMSPFPNKWVCTV